MARKRSQSPALTRWLTPGPRASALASFSGKRGSCLSGRRGEPFPAQGRLAIHSIIRGDIQSYRLKKQPATAGPSFHYLPLLPWPNDFMGLIWPRPGHSHPCNNAGRPLRKVPEAPAPVQDSPSASLWGLQTPPTCVSLRCTKLRLGPTSPRSM